MAQTPFDLSFFETALTVLPPEITQLWVAFSGGLDSTVLLYALANVAQTHSAQSGKKYSVRAIHVNHGVSCYADVWQTHCERVCEQWTIPLTLCKASIDIERVREEGLEAILRDARYACFKAFMDPSVCVVTAHHADDQAETLLLRLLRGSGPKGLSGMQVLTVFAKGWLWRPLLSWPREALLSFATGNQLEWIEDESNQDASLDRNFMRHHVIPLLKTRWPSAEMTLARSARLCQEGDRLLCELAKSDWFSVAGEKPERLEMPILKAWSPERQRNVLRYWLGDVLKFPLPSEVKLNQILEEVIGSRTDRTPCVSWSTVEVRRYRDVLYAGFLLPKQEAALIKEWPLQTGTRSAVLEVSSFCILQATQEKGQGVKIPSGSQLTVRFRQGGEKIRVKGRAHHQALKKLMQDWGIPPWLRDRIPLIYIDNSLACVVSHAICADFAVAADEEGWVFYATQAV